MNLYIIITNTILNTGGGPRYVLQKKLYLERKDWKVLVLSDSSDSMVLPGLEEYENWISPMVRYPLWLWPKSVLREFILKVKCFSKKSSQTVVESHNPSRALLGEYLAKSLNAKHIVYLLDELPECSRQELSFFGFKHKRRELCAITPNSVSILFQAYKEVPTAEQYCLQAAGASNAKVSEDSFPLFTNLPKADYTVGSLGRLDKPYIPHSVDSVIEFAQKHSNQKINFLMIGDGNHRKAVEEKCSAISNLFLVITGYLSIIPKQFFEICDVVIASAGSAILSGVEGTPTIAIDSQDYLPLGILGYTTQETLFRIEPPPCDVAELLEKILMEHICERLEFKGVTKYPKDTDVIFKAHIDFIEKSSQEQEYYDTMIPVWTLKNIIKKLFVTIFAKTDGNSRPLFYKIRNLWRKNF